MAYTQTQIDAAKAALASGVLTVVFEGRSVTYRSVDDLQKAITAMEAANRAESGTRRRQTRLMGSKGF